MSKKIFGERPLSQREQCLEIAARLKRETGELIAPSLVTDACIREGVFTRAQLDSYQFQGARRQVEQWLKTLDSSGVNTWGQLPLTNSDGEMLWEKRTLMDLTGYAWNYLLRDDVAVKNAIMRDRWRTEALKRWTATEFEQEVERLRAEREGDSNAAD